MLLFKVFIDHIVSVHVLYGWLGIDAELELVS